MDNYPRLVIAGIRGGSGKTTISLGLIAALRTGRGLRVIPYKKGPDYIDAGWMSQAAHHPCYNLDPFLVPRERIEESFLAHFTGDIAVIEGNRGLYDGMDPHGTYSTAELSKILRAPVILVVDCTKMTRTAAAVVLGCMELDREVQIRGVILNHISGTRHERVVRAAIESHCRLPVLGVVPRQEEGAFPERHMGLLPFHEHPDTERAVSFAEDLAKRYLDIDGILDRARKAEPLPPVTLQERPDEVGRRQESQVVRIGVVRDSAFQFYYPENLDELERAGACIVEVSALTEERVPEIDALYIGGGFPETHAIALAENSAFRESLKSAIMDGLPVYAECGGLMYLGEGLLLDGKIYPMTGVFPLLFSLEKKPQAHGYSVVRVVQDNPFYPKETVLRGHEFHYSKPVDALHGLEGVTYAFSVERGQGITAKRDGICFRNVLATYTHLHAHGAPEWVEGMVRSARGFRGTKAWPH